MNSTHIHLLLNHFPIVGTLLGTVLLMYGVVLRKEIIQKVSLTTIFVMALIAIPVFLTGEPAEESVEKLPGVIESITEAHEEAGEVAFWIMIVAGGISFIGLVLQQLQHKTATAIVLLSLVLSITASGLMARAGYLGGQIRHTEIRGNVGTNQAVEQGVEEDAE